MSGEHMTERPIPSEAIPCPAPDNAEPAWLACDCKRGACPACEPAYPRALTLAPPDGGLDLRDDVRRESRYRARRRIRAAAGRDAEALDAGWNDVQAFLDGERAADDAADALAEEVAREDVRRSPAMWRPPAVDRRVAERVEAMRGLSFGQRVEAGRIRDLAALRAHCDRVREEG